MQCNAAVEENITSEYGVIASKNYPNPYPDNINKTWNIFVKPGFKVRIYFTTFDLEDSYEEETGFCAYDYVKVYWWIVQ